MVVWKKIFYFSLPFVGKWSNLNFLIWKRQQKTVGKYYAHIFLDISMAAVKASGIHWGFGLNHCIICQNHFDIHIKQSSLTKGPEKHGKLHRPLWHQKGNRKSGVCKDQGGKNNRKSWSSVVVVPQGDMIGEYTYIIWYVVPGSALGGEGTKIVRRRGQTQTYCQPTQVLERTSPADLALSCLKDLQSSDNGTLCQFTFKVFTFRTIFIFLISRFLFNRDLTKPTFPC